MAGTISTGNYTIGSGTIYFCGSIGDQKVLGTSLQNSNYSLGNIVDTEMSLDVSYVDHYVSVDGKRIKDKSVAVTSVLQLNFTFDEMNQTNMQRFFLGTASASEIRVLQDTVAEGSAQLKVETDIGQDMLYKIPKCTLKPDGALSLNDEDWHQAPMMLEVLQYTTGETAGNATLNSSLLLIPFGAIDKSAL